jgi:hypothetical protein
MTLREHNINKQDNFIAGWYSDQSQVCDEIINHFKNSNETFDGKFGNDKVDSTIKKSTDLSLVDVDLVNAYSSLILGPVIEEYKSKYEFCNKNCDRWGISEYIKVQHYKPGEGFYGWHTERSGASNPYVYRYLVFMTYLNDVKIGGETEFYHQRTKIKPEKGLTLIWGSDWTFTHRGIAAPKEDKYIVTGWFSFLT